MAAGRTGSGMALPAYSGGTAWDSHPLRLAAGLSQFRLSISATPGLTVSIYSLRYNDVIENPQESSPEGL